MLKKVSHTSILLKIDAIFDIQLMGPEEIHIYFLEGAPRPQKENMIDPKTWKFCLVIFQIWESQLFF